MNKEEFIAKYGRQKLTNIREHRHQNIEENNLCVTIDFNVPVPPKEEGMSANEYRDFELERGEDLAYNFQRIISFRWYRTHKEDCIVVVTPIIYRREYRMRCEFYAAKMVPGLKDWLMETIKGLDYE